ncbi:hypothetical protein [Salmonella enterica]|uniref:hypothetical protein n=1 Tax=Salmonella enterica TaxID=28901 RepID=UPI003857CF5F
MLSGLWVGEAQIDKLHFVFVRHRQTVQRTYFVLSRIGHGRRRGNEISIPLVVSL